MPETVTIIQLYLEDVYFPKINIFGHLKWILHCDIQMQWVKQSIWTCLYFLLIVLFQLVKEGTVKKGEVELLLSASERSRHWTELYYHLTKPLYFHYTHLVCREAIPGEINPWSAESFYINNREERFFSNVLVSSFRFIWIPMLWINDHYKFVYFYSAGVDFSRQNLTSTDVRFWRLKSIPAL